MCHKRDDGRDMWDAYYRAQRKFCKARGHVTEDYWLTARLGLTGSLDSGACLGGLTAMKRKKSAATASEASESWIDAS